MLHQTSGMIVNDAATMASSTTDDTFNIPFSSSKPLIGGTTGGIVSSSNSQTGQVYTESNKFESTVRQFSKQQSAGSTCSIANSVCSSTAATIGSLSTIITASTSSNARNKRKKNFDEDDDDDDESSFTQFTADSSSDMVMSSGAGGAIARGGADVEIQANQDGCQNNNNNQNQN